MTTFRERMHMSYCPSLGACIGLGHTAAPPACAKFDELLAKVEDERVHAEAEKLRQRGEELKIQTGNHGIGMAMAATLLVEAVAMDPYEVRGEKLVRKSNGTTVMI